MRFNRYIYVLCRCGLHLLLSQHTCGEAKSMGLALRLAATRLNTVNHSMQFDLFLAVTKSQLSINAAMLFFVKPHEQIVYTYGEQWAHIYMHTHEIIFWYFLFASATPTSNTFFSFHFEFHRHSLDGWMCFASAQHDSCVCARLMLVDCGTIRSFSRHEFDFELISLFEIYIATGKQNKKNAIWGKEMFENPLKVAKNKRHRSGSQRSWCVLMRRAE